MVHCGWAFQSVLRLEAVSSVSMHVVFEAAMAVGFRP